MLFPLVEDFLVERSQDAFVEVALLAEISLRVFVVSRSFRLVKGVIPDYIGVLSESLCQLIPEIKELILKLLARVVKLVIEIDSFGSVREIEFGELQAGLV